MSNNGVFEHSTVLAFLCNAWCIVAAKEEEMFLIHSLDGAIAFGEYKLGKKRIDEV